MIKNRLITDADSVLPAALDAIGQTSDPRLQVLFSALTRHMHAFVSEVRLSEDEFEHALDFLVSIGQATCASKNEVVLAADLFGISTQVALMNARATGESDAALLGPFWRRDAPERAKSNE